MALLEFFLAAAGAWIVAADIFQRIAHRILMAVVAVGSVHMAVAGIMVMSMGMGMLMVAVRGMDMGFVGHCSYSGMKLPGMISPERDRCTLRVNHEPAST